MQEMSKNHRQSMRDKMVFSVPNLSKPYSKGPYNKFDEFEQWIRISEGCPNGCLYCRESYENGKGEVYFEIPEIVRNHVKIIDMNLCAKSKAKEIIKFLGDQKVNGKVVYYELICGIDFRYLDQEMADLLKKNRFINIRLAWDYGFGFQKQIKKSIQFLLKSGYRSSDLSIFILANWETSYKQSLMKLDFCKVWRVKVNDCWFDDQLSPNIWPIHWTSEEIKDFRRRCRKHNHLVLFGIDPLFKG